MGFFLLGLVRKQPKYQNVYICFQAGMYFLFLNDVLYIIPQYLKQDLLPASKTKPTLLLKHARAVWDILWGSGIFLHDRDDRALLL